MTKALKITNSSPSFVHYSLDERKYWNNFNDVIFAIYKHGSDLIDYWSLSASREALRELPQEIVQSALNRNSNVAKIIAPKGFEREIFSWSRKLKMALEINVYEPALGLEVLYAPGSKKIKFAGTLESINVETQLQKVKVLIVDDSKVIRSLLKEALSSNEKFEVIAETGQPLDVANLIKKHQPDVMTLDINMPQMSGVELIETLGRENLPATVVVSSLNMNEGTLVMRALENGAFDYIQKPTLEARAEFTEQLLEKLILAANSKVQLKRRVISGPSLRQAKLETDGLIVIGASTGGTEAVKAVLRHLPKNIPPILIVQHIPPVFSRAFADSLDSMCEFDVKEAEDGDKLEPGRAYVAPGGMQMRLKKDSRNSYSLSITKGEKISGHSPSVDCLFSSVAQTYQGKAIALLLTGMGADGAKGLLNLKQKNVFTVAQNEETCVVFGMPKQAIKLNATQKVIGLHEMAHEISNYFRK